MAFAQDSEPPTFSAITSTSQIAGSNTTLTCTVSDASGVAFVVPSWNNSGAWVNASALNAGGSLSYIANFTGTSNATVGNVISAKFYANDTLGNAGTTECDFTLTRFVYAVSLSTDKTVYQIGTLVTIFLNATRGGVAYSSLLANVTKDDEPYQTNCSVSFTAIETIPQGHKFNITDLYDSELSCSVPFTSTPLDLIWTGAISTSNSSSSSSSGSSSSTSTSSSSNSTNGTPALSILGDASDAQNLQIEIVLLIFLVSVAVVLAANLVAERMPKKRKDRPPFEW